MISVYLGGREKSIISHARPLDTFENQEGSH